MKLVKKIKTINSSPKGQLKKQYQPSSVRGLVTNQEQSIKSYRTQSQVSDYTQKTKTSQSIAGSQEYDNFDEDIEKQGLREVFISEEEEKVIQKILEITRKGKINQKNAFQIPLKVIENQNFSLNQTKFWKFASELLGASINIYEKRIENAWINTNIIHDKLARMTLGDEKSENDDDYENGMNKAQTKEFLVINIEEFRDSKILDNVRLGEETLEQIEKINIVKLKQQFTDDPLFHRKVKAFDNTSLKGLLLNIFDLSSTCEIELFSNENKLQAKPMIIIEKNQRNIPQQSQIIKQQLLLEKQKNINMQIFEKVSSFKKENQLKNQQWLPQCEHGLLNTENYNNQQPIFQQFMADLKHDGQKLYSQMPIFDEFTHQLNSNELKMCFPRTVTSENGQSSQETKSQLMSNRQEYTPKSFSFNSPFGESLMDQSFHSVMTPWQLEFKEGKLRKKSLKRERKREMKKREKIQIQQISFDALLVQNKKITIKHQNLNKQYEEKKKKRLNLDNLLPPQLSVYEKIIFKKYRKNNEKIQKMQQKPSQTQQNDLPSFLVPDPSMMEMKNNEKPFEDKLDSQNMNYHPTEQIFGTQYYMRPTFNQDNQPFPLHKPCNIRQTKRNLFEKAKEERQLRISEVDVEGLSPSSLLITFLHIANEKNMIVRSTPNEDDAILSWE